MEQSPVDNPASQEPPSLFSRIWQVLRWLPLLLMLLTIGALLVWFIEGGLKKITAWYLLQFVPPLLGLFFVVAILFYAATKQRFGRLMLVTFIIALVSLSPIILWVMPIAYPASLETTTPSATIRLPAEAPLKVLWGGDKIETNYHAMVPDQRWAYDLAIAPYLTGSAKLEDYGCYGVPVVAPVRGQVSSAHDGEPDATPGVTSNNFEAPTGNHVVIHLETDTYLVIAHLKQGSVAVKSGDRVEEGQVIGQCGNSGNTSEPHIHIHHQRQDPAVYPINFAEGLPLYFRDHDGPPMPDGGVKVETDDKMTATGATVQHIGK